MKSSSFKYLLKEGLTNVWLNRLMSLASVGVLATCLILVGAASLISFNITKVISFVEEQNEMVIFLKDDYDTEKVDAVIQSLKKDSKLLSVSFVSKEQALQEQMDRMGGDAALFEGLEDDNPLPASIRLKLKDLTNLSHYEKLAKSYEFADTVKAPTNVANTLANFKRMVDSTGVVAITVLIVISLIIIINTINATIFTRRTEISIMKMVGATDNFIRFPFFVEGIVLGLISAVLAFFVIMGTYSGATKIFLDTNSVLLANAGGALIPFGKIWHLVLLSFAASGMVTGGIASVICLKKHLKV